LLPWLEHAAGLLIGAVSVAYLAGALGTTLVWASITGQVQLPESIPATSQVQPASTSRRGRGMPCALPHCRARRSSPP
jgi:hypothetical protein